MNTTDNSPIEDESALVNDESEAATQELLAIPGLLERVKGVAIKYRPEPPQSPILGDLERLGSPPEWGI